MNNDTSYRLEFNLSAINTILSNVQRQEVNLYNQIFNDTLQQDELTTEQMERLRKTLTTKVKLLNRDTYINSSVDLLKKINFDGKQSRFKSGDDAYFDEDSRDWVIGKKAYQVPTSVKIAYDSIKVKNNGILDKFKHGRVEEAIQSIWAVEVAKTLGKNAKIHLTDDNTNLEENILYDIDIMFNNNQHIYSEIKASLDDFHIGYIEKGLEEGGKVIYQEMRDYLSSSSTLSNVKINVSEETSRGDKNTTYINIKVQLVVPEQVYDTLGSKFAEIKFQKAPIYKSGNTIKFASEILKDLRDKSKASVILTWLWDVDKNTVTIEGEQTNMGLPYYTSYDTSDPGDRRVAEQAAKEIMSKTWQLSSLQLKKLDLWYGKPS